MVLWMVSVVCVMMIQRWLDRRQVSLVLVAAVGACREFWRVLCECFDLWRFQFSLIVQFTATNQILDANIQQIAYSFNVPERIVVRGLFLLRSTFQNPNRR